MSAKQVKDILSKINITPYGCVVLWWNDNVQKLSMYPIQCMLPTPYDNMGCVFYSM